MIRRAIPTGFSRQADTGRTKPLRIALATEDGEECEAVLKVSVGIELGVEGLMNEVLGALVAADVGLPVPEPFFVELTAEFCDSVSIPDVRARLQASCPIAFASRDTGKQWRSWNAADRVSVAQEGTALATMAFDAFIGNSDRSPGNPNLRVKDQDWRLIDHESGFSFRLKLFPPCQPWTPGNLSGMMTIGARSEHVFASHLSGKGALSFGPIKAAWAGLSDARLAQYDAILPQEWEPARSPLTEALDHLRKVRDSIDPCLTELQRILS